MDTTTQRTNPSPTTSGSFWSFNSTTILDEYSCKPFQSDTIVSKELKILFYSFLLLFSVLGNSLLIAIIKRSKRMKTITNYLIANMAVSDILITVLAVPRQITEILLGPRRWLIDGLLGSVLCKGVNFFQDITIGVSILSLSAIAIDRYRGIVFPLREQFKKPAKLCKFIIPAIWLISMGLQAIYFYILRIVTVDNKTHCAVNWAPKFDQKRSQEAHFIVIFVCLVAIPACVVTFLYSAVILNLKRCRHRRSEGLSRYLISERSREDMKVVIMIIAILVAFIVCIMPINVYAFLYYFFWDWKIPCGMENFAFSAFFILYSNASINPCIYFTLNDKYRQGLVNILKAFPLVRKKAAKSTENFVLVRLKNSQASSGLRRQSSYAIGKKLSSLQTTV